jgi:two-component system NtrC family sensor kinase
MGHLCRAINAMADAVSLREAQLKLATRKHIGRAEKLASVGRLSAGIAHEINNPLTGVLTFAHLLREKENMTEEDKADLDVIISETKRVSEVVGGLLDFARERPSKKELLDVSQIVGRTMRLVRSQRQIEQVMVKEDLAENLPAVTGDANQLEQVLLNLSLNALEAMPNGGRLSIQTLAEGDKVIIKVVDTGCGIKQEHLDEVFEPFFSTKPVGTGTGLGLSVSYGIIEQHGGTLEAESQEGQGTTMTITLPAAESESTEDRQDEGNG